MTREEAISKWIIPAIKNTWNEKRCKEILEALEQEPILDKIRAEIEQKIEQERFARSVFRGEEKDAVKAEQCTGSIFAYNNVIRLIDNYKAEIEPQESENKKCR